MAKFKKLALLCTAILGTACLATAVACNDSSSSASEGGQSTGGESVTPVVPTAAEGILPNVVSVAAGETKKYEYTATVDGSVSFDVYGDVEVSAYVGEKAEYYGAVLVKKGDKVTIDVTGKNGAAVENATFYVKETTGASYFDHLALPCVNATYTTVSKYEMNEYEEMAYTTTYYTITTTEFGVLSFESENENISIMVDYEEAKPVACYPGMSFDIEVSAVAPEEGEPAASVDLSFDVSFDTNLIFASEIEADNYILGMGVFAYTAEKDGVVKFECEEEEEGSSGAMIQWLGDIMQIDSMGPAPYAINQEIPVTAGVTNYFMLVSMSGYPVYFTYEDKEYVVPQDGSSAFPYEIKAGEDTVTTIEMEDSPVYYCYTAEKDSTLVFSSESLDFFVLIYNAKYDYVEGNIELNANVSLKAGETLTIAINSYTADDYTWKLTVTEGIEPDGFDVPFELISGTAITLNYDRSKWATQSAVFTAPADGTLTFSDITENCWVVDMNTNASYDASAETEDLSDSFSVKKGSVVTLSAEGDMSVTFTMTFTEGTVEADGSSAYKANTASATNKTTLSETVSYIYYTYTATADGTITFMSDDETPAIIRVGMSSYEYNTSYNVKAGEVITFMVVAPYGEEDYVYGEFNWNIVFTANATGVDFTSRIR